MQTAVMRKSERFLERYLPLLNDLQIQHRFRGYFKATLSMERLTAWIKSANFPDNVFVDLRRVNPELRPFMKAGNAVEFGIELN